MALCDFVYKGSSSKVIFGRGGINKLAEELGQLHLFMPLLLSTPAQVDQTELLKRILGTKISGVFTEAAMHTPVSITDKAVEYAHFLKADCLISIGGGSTVGLGKAISFRTGLPHICIPTTYAGSEMTPILGETLAGRKTTRSDPKILPGTIIYDVDLTLTLPPGLSATSGFNAIAHAVEALYARDANPIVSLLALEGIKSLANALPRILETSEDLEARSLAQYGAWLCGHSLGSVGMALHHKLCHTLGGSFNMPHAETHTIVLPHALAYNAPSVPEVMEKLAQVLPESDGDAIHGLNVLLAKLKVQRGLRSYGFTEIDIDKAADLAVSNPYWNPRDIQREPIRELLRRAYAGEEARADL